MALTHRNVCHHCNIQNYRDIDRCKKTNCRFIDSWFVRILEKDKALMQGEINLLNKKLDKYD